MNHEERGPWYLLTGLIIGIALGLLYAWLVQPVEYVDTTPASLRSDFKDHYRSLIAAAYLGNNDLVRARARLGLLQDQDVFRTIAAQAQRMLAENGSAGEARALGLLAIALGQAPPGPAVAITQQRLATQPPTAQPEKPSAPTDTQVPDEVITEQPEETSPATQVSTDLPATATDTPAPSSTPSPTSGKTATATQTPRPRPTLTPTRTPRPTDTPGGPFLLLSKEKDCEQQYAQPLVQVEALDRFNQPVPGVLVIVNWRDDEERFYTGLKPEKGPGYADFTLTPGILYTLRLGENGMAVLDLAALECNRQGAGRYWGAWVLKFVQP